MEIDAILWRRLDTAGHDACRLVTDDGARRLEGAAVFEYEGVPAYFAYDVDCDEEWRTREGFIRGWLGARRFDFRIARTQDAVWTLNGRVVPGLDGCVDLDLEFTPATNLFQLRRIALEVGQAADLAVAWLDVHVGAFDVLQQRYERRGAEVYWYEAPRFGYFALLQVSAVGFVERYPNLWEAEARSKGRAVV
ncbi:MAG: putative glycolipid-binding domain-containing protein [Deltaproteobacteria bacterium]|nr:putative glycolipid-binding domain-containing protein [Deltaproteobacteria bacterium]